MFPDILNLLVVGFAAGFVFSMPVAGPVSILITSSALKGKLRFCQRTALGASIAEFVYVFIGLVGIKSLYEFYRPFIPYLLIVGAIFLLIVSIKVVRTKLNFGALNKKEIVSDREKNKGGLRTGLILNFTNPALFISWLASSFLIFSLMSSFHLSTGGLNLLVEENVSSISEMSGGSFEKLKEIEKEFDKAELPAGKQDNEISVLVLATVYSAAIAFGGFIWLSLFSSLVVKYRYKLNINIINIIIKLLGLVLIIISFYLIYKAIIFI